MKRFAFLLLITASVCFADICNPMPNSGIFRVVCEQNKRQKEINSTQKEIKNSLDSISAKAAEKAQILAWNPPNF